MNTSTSIRVSRIIVNEVQYLWDKNTNTLYNPITYIPIGVLNPSTNAIQPYEGEAELPIPVYRTTINGVQYFRARNTNTLYDITTDNPVGVWNQITNTIDPYEEEDDDDNKPNLTNLDMITESIDRVELYFKANIQECQNNQSGVSAKVQFYVEEEQRIKKCELFTKLNKRYILETNTEKKNKLKQMINTVSETIKTDCLEMIEATDCNEGLYLIYCDIAKKRYKIINDLMKMNKLADELAVM